LAARWPGSPGPTDQRLQLNLPRENGAAADSIAAQVSGTGRTTLAVEYLAEIADELASKQINLGVTEAYSAVEITDPDDTNMLALLMPCRA
jgi:DNA polymerase III sliding clamp (beta) subunit (PCNA family)